MRVLSKLIVGLVACVLVVVIVVTVLGVAAEKLHIFGDPQARNQALAEPYLDACRSVIRPTPTPEGGVSAVRSCH